MVFFGSLQPVFQMFYNFQQMDGLLYNKSAVKLRPSDYNLHNSQNNLT